MGMKLASKLNDTLMVKSKLFELIKGVFNITGPANTQKDSMKSHSFCTYEFAEVCSACFCCAASNCCPPGKRSKFRSSVPLPFIPPAWHGSQWNAKACVVRPLFYWKHKPPVGQIVRVLQSWKELLLVQWNTTHINYEKRILRAEALCIPSIKRKKKEVNRGQEISQVGEKVSFHVACSALRDEEEDERFNAT
eukprot:1153604-Pelagomonas_calceolata.AAC.1